MPSVPLAPLSRLALERPIRRVAAAEATRVAGIDPIARLWFALAVGSLVVAGLLSLAVVVGRLPVLSRIIDDPLFFKRCLVVHVDLALVVWFYAFIAGLLTLIRRGEPGRGEWLTFSVTLSGVLAMLAGGLVRGAQPILSNYVPVIDHPLFGAGLAAFSLGLLLTLVHALAAPADANSPLPADARLGLRAAALLVVVAGATWVSARAGLPEGVDAYTRAEFLAWGPGHVLQAANTAAMLAVWLWLVETATGARVLPPRAAGGVFAALILPQSAMPLLTMRGTLDTLYHSGATQLMRWAIFPAVVLVATWSLVHLWRHRHAAPRRTPAGRAAVAGFTGSLGLAALGMILGACIRGSTTLVPAHYHASLGAVTLAFMTAAYLVCRHERRTKLSLTGANGGDGVRGKPTPRIPQRPSVKSLWSAARRQLALFGFGQAVFALGFAIGGAYGLGRKAYAAEQHVRSAGELTGLLVMGAGGLVAVAGGLWFLFLVLREMRGWWTRDTARLAAAQLHLS
jgi:hypothetical protein